MATPSVFDLTLGTTAAAPSPMDIILGPHAALAADPNRDRIYLSHSPSESVIVWNTSSDAELASIPIGAGPGRMDLSWTGEELYVTLAGEQALAVVNLTSLSLSAIIPLSVTPVDVAAGRPGRAYVTTTESWGHPRIVNTESGVVVGEITAAGLIYQGALARTTLNRATLFIAETGLSPASVYAFDVTTDTVTLTSEAPFGSVGDNLGDFAVSPTQPWLFIASGWPYHIQVVDYRTWTPVRPLDTGPYPNGVGLAQRGGLAFAAHASSDVIAFDTANGSRLDSFSFTQEVKAVQASRDGTKVYAITADIYGDNRRVERIATGFPVPPDGPPIAFALAEPSYGYAPAQFTFSGGATSGTPPYSFHWDFEDGATNRSWRAVHVYSSVGTHTATLTVVDAENQEAVTSVSVYAAQRPLPNKLSVGSSFPGLGFSLFTNFVVPPDVQVAAGPDHVVEMVNVRIGMWTRNGNQVMDEPLTAFFGRPDGALLADPRILYDAPTGHWFATAFDIEDEQVFLAVSEGMDPTGEWRQHSLSAFGCPDQPILGVSPMAVVISVNLFATCFGEEVYSGAQYWVINKTDLLNDRTPRVESFGPFPELASLHPVQVVGAADPMYLVSVGWAHSPTESLLVYPIRGAPPDVEPGPVIQVPIRPVNQPPNVPQRDATDQVNTGDARVMTAVVDHGSIWLTFGSACSPEGTSLNQSCVRILQVDTTTYDLVQDFDVSDRVRGFFYPAFRLDGAGNLVLVFGYSSTTEYPGLMAAVQLAEDPRNTVRAPVILQVGSGREVLACANGSCRYGDYFGASNDPLDPEAVWVAGEYGAPSGWRTTVASVGLFRSVNFTAAYSIPQGGEPANNPVLTYVSKARRYEVSLTNTPQRITLDLGTRWTVTGSLPGGVGERWVLNGDSSGTAAVPQDLTVVYDHEYLVSLESRPAAGGTIFPASGWFTAGSTLHLSATPAAGWQFGGWTGTGSGAYSGPEAEKDLLIIAPLTESASFNPGIRIDATAGGTVDYSYENVSGHVSSGGTVTLYLRNGTMVNLYATPGFASQFVGWVGNMSGTGVHASLVVTGPSHVIAAFTTDVSALGAAVGIAAFGIIAVASVILVVRSRRRRSRVPTPEPPGSPPPTPPG